MKDELLVPGNMTLRNAIAQLDAGGRGALFVINEKKVLIGIVTDGDIRRAILKNVDLSVPICQVMNRQFTAWPETRSIEEAALAMRKLKRRHMPIVDNDGIIVDIVLLDDIAFKYNDNTVVIMAGGLGSRLGDLTRDCPKPLLKIGSKPILETILDNFVEYGFRNFYFAVNYKAEMIENYFGNGERWGISIKYIRETTQLGTAGALSLLPIKPRKPIVVMNGDLLTKVNFQHLLDFHNEHHAKATICVREYDLQIPFGVVEINNNHRVQNIKEKPVHRHFVNAGMYVLDSDILEKIPVNQYFDMPTLLAEIIKTNQHVSAFPVMEYWMDIGRLGDFERANDEYAAFFG